MADPAGTAGAALVGRGLRAGSQFDHRDGRRARTCPGRADEPTPDRTGDEAQLSFLDIAGSLEPFFGAGHLVLGPTMDALVDASRSARAAAQLSGMGYASAVNMGGIAGWKGNVVKGET